MQNPPSILQKWILIRSPLSLPLTRAVSIFVSMISNNQWYFHCTNLQMTFVFVEQIHRSEIIWNNLNAVFVIPTRLAQCQNILNRFFSLPNTVATRFFELIGNRPIQEIELFKFKCVLFCLEYFNLCFWIHAMTKLMMEPNDRFISIVQNEKFKYEFHQSIPY